ncbi:hypothetical protein FOA52_014275 [Chlamydomonas sp. UWO 241]|nr:hypothetical protein FOA52_014275 [Chlamydomonas sp. UWO 241]
MADAPPPYDAPSVGAPPPYDARAVDAWALGVLLFLLTSGSYPFEDPCDPANVISTVTNVVLGRKQPWPGGMSAECRRVIEGLLVADPRRRTTLAQLKADTWVAGQAAAHAQALGLQPSHAE